MDSGGAPGCGGARPRGEPLNPSARPAPRTLVVGGGIAGLALARALHREGRPVELIDQVEVWAPVGAGILLQANAVAILEALGLADAVERSGHRLETMRVADARGRTLQTLHSADLPALAPPRAFHRADLHGLLLDGAAGVPIRLGETVDALTPEPHGVEVLFASGRRERFDLVVGADGLRSRVRDLAVPEAPGPTKAGYTVWRVVTTSGPPLDAAWELWGDGRRVGLVPLTHGRLYAFLVLPLAGDEGPGREGRTADLGLLRSRFAGFARPAAALLSGLGPDDTLLHHDVEALPEPVWGRGRVVLVGDAAHAMTPDLAQGAAQALEDAAALTVALRQTPDLEVALARFRLARDERVRKVLAHSARMGATAQWSGRVRTLLRNTGARLTPDWATRRLLQALLGPGLELGHALARR